MTQHTQSRMQLEVVGGSETVIISTIEGDAVAEPCNWGSITDVEQQKANFRRLVACWNACEGLTTEHLENINMLGETLAGRFAAFHASERELMDTRDELLAALKVMLRNYAAVYDIGDVEMQPAIYQALAAIANGGIMTESQRKAMEQALDALKTCSGVPHWPALEPVKEALIAALAEPAPVQEPAKVCPYCNFNGSNNCANVADEIRKNGGVPGSGHCSNFHAYGRRTAQPRKAVKLTYGEVVDAIEDSAAPVRETAPEPVADDLRDRLVAISAAIADQDDRAAQAMLSEILSAPRPAPVPLLTDAEIKAAVTDAVKQGAISWLGFEKDASGFYTIPAMSDSHYQLSRVIEALVRQKAGL
jgi:hypothetical protein